MEQDTDQVPKPIKIERLLQAIDEIDMKVNKLIEKKEEQINNLIAKKEEQVNKLLAKKAELKNELENTQKTSLWGIMTSHYKTPEELAAFISQAIESDFKVDFLKQNQEEKQKRTEVENELLANDTSEA